LRDIDIFGAEKIAAVGDDNLIITTGIPTGTPVMYKSKLSKSRLRTVSFLDAGKVIFGNVSGEIFLYNLNTKEELKLLGKPIAEQSLNSMVVMNNTVFAIDQGKLVALSPSTGRKSELTLDRPRQLFALGSNSILVRAQDGLFLLNTATQQIEKITVEGKLPELTAVVLGNDKVFFGDESGRIFTYKVNSALNRLQLLDKWTIRAHRTRVTALQYDGQGNRLFTASMDRTSKILDLNLENLEKAEAYAVRLEGYAKWIWDFELVTYKDNNLELFSVDEKGMLMRRVPVTAMYKQLTNWLKKEKAL
jgi:WD40 repeat protein